MHTHPIWWVQFGGEIRMSLEVDPLGCLEQMEMETKASARSWSLGKIHEWWFRDDTHKWWFLKIWYISKKQINKISIYINKYLYVCNCVIYISNLIYLKCGYMDVYEHTICIFSCFRLGADATKSTHWTTGWLDQSIVFCKYILWGALTNSPLSCQVYFHFPFWKVGQHSRTDPQNANIAQRGGHATQGRVIN